MLYVLILQLRHTSNRVTEALVRLILAFVVRKKGVFSGHFVISRCFKNELFLKQNFKNNEIYMPNSLDRDQTRRFCLKSASLSDLINTVWRRHVILYRGRRFLDMFKTLRPAHFHAFCSHDHSRSIKKQRATVFHLIFAFLSCLIVKAPKKLLKRCIHLLLSSTAEPGS